MRIQSVDVFIDDSTQFSALSGDEKGPRGFRMSGGVTQPDLNIFIPNLYRDEWDTSAYRVEVLDRFLEALQEVRRQLLQAAVEGRVNSPG